MKNKEKEGLNEHATAESMTVHPTLEAERLAGVLRPCTCKDHSTNVAIITTSFYEPPEPWQVSFVRLNAGKLVCSTCGGEVQPEQVPNRNWDHVTATTITVHLQRLGLIGPPTQPQESGTSPSTATEQARSDNKTREIA